MRDFIIKGRQKIQTVSSNLTAVLKWSKSTVPPQPKGTLMHWNLLNIMAMRIHHHTYIFKKEMWEYLRLGHFPSATR